MEVRLYICKAIKSVHVKMVLTKATHVFLTTRYKRKCQTIFRILCTMVYTTKTILQLIIHGSEKLGEEQQVARRTRIACLFTFPPRQRVCVTKRFLREN